MGLFLAVAVAKAFTDWRLILALIYVGIGVAHRRLPLRLGPGGVVVIGVFLDYLRGALGFATPVLGRASRQWHKIAKGYLTDRYRQLLIISLGEMVLVAGRGDVPHRNAISPTGEPLV